MAFKRPANASGSCCVFVRGFDFGTTDNEVLGHMSSVGSIVSVEQIDKGSAGVTYSSAEEAAAAVEQLQGTTIPGNTRFIDVLPAEAGEPLAKRINSGGKGGDGGRRANASGGGCVLVRGFDFGTTDDQLLGHMSTVGSIVNVKWINNGSAEVTYSSADEAAAAIQQLQSTTISGNRRFIDVLPAGGGDPPTNPFLSGGKGCGGGMPAGAYGSTGLSRSCGGGIMPADAYGNHSVFVRGFDFGTTELELGGHMSRAGSVVHVKWIDNGSAEVTYSSAHEATAAVQQLHASTIYGNKRFIDVLPSGGGAPPTNFTLFPYKLLPPGGPSGGKVGVGGMPASASGNCCVFVRGFDFGTTDEQLVAHMSRAGSIMSVTWMDNGSAEVVYSSAHEAAAAVQQLQATTIPGNRRFIDVLLSRDQGCSGGMPGKGMAKGLGKGKGFGNALKHH